MRQIHTIQEPMMPALQYRPNNLKLTTYFYLLLIFLVQSLAEETDQIQSLKDGFHAAADIETGNANILADEAPLYAITDDFKETSFSLMTGMLRRLYPQANWDDVLDLLREDAIFSSNNDPARKNAIKQHALTILQRDKTTEQPEVTGTIDAEVTRVYLKHETDLDKYILHLNKLEKVNGLLPDAHKAALQGYADLLMENEYDRRDPKIRNIVEDAVVRFLSFPDPSFIPTTFDLLLKMARPFRLIYIYQWITANHGYSAADLYPLHLADVYQLYDFGDETLTMYAKALSIEKNAEIKKRINNAYRAAAETKRRVNEWRNEPLVLEINEEVKFPIGFPKLQQQFASTDIRIDWQYKADCIYNDIIDFMAFTNEFAQSIQRNDIDDAIRVLEQERLSKTYTEFGFQATEKLLEFLDSNSPLTVGINFIYRGYLYDHQSNYFIAKQDTKNALEKLSQAAMNSAYISSAKRIEFLKKITPLLLEINDKVSLKTLLDSEKELLEADHQSEFKNLESLLETHVKMSTPVDDEDIATLEFISSLFSTIETLPISYSYITLLFSVTLFTATICLLGLERRQTLKGLYDLEYEYFLNALREIFNPDAVAKIEDLYIKMIKIPTYYHGLYHIYSADLPVFGISLDEITERLQQQKHINTDFIPPQHLFLMDTMLKTTGKERYEFLHALLQIITEELSSENIIDNQDVSINFKFQSGFVKCQLMKFINTKPMDISDEEFDDGNCFAHAEQRFIEMKNDIVAGFLKYIASEKRKAKKASRKRDKRKSSSPTIQVHIKNDLKMNDYSRQVESLFASARLLPENLFEIEKVSRASQRAEISKANHTALSPFCDNIIKTAKSLGDLQSDEIDIIERINDIKQSILNIEEGFIEKSVYDSLKKDVNNLEINREHFIKTQTAFENALNTLQKQTDKIEQFQESRSSKQEPEVVRLPPKPRKPRPKKIATNKKKKNEDKMQPQKERDKTVIGPAVYNIQNLQGNPYLTSMRIALTNIYDVISRTSGFDEAMPIMLATNNNLQAIKNDLREDSLDSEQFINIISYDCLLNALLRLFNGLHELFNAHDVYLPEFVSKDMVNDIRNMLAHQSYLAASNTADFVLCCHDLYDYFIDVIDKIENQQIQDIEEYDLTNCYIAQCINGGLRTDDAFHLQSIELFCHRLNAYMKIAVHLQEKLDKFQDTTILHGAIRYAITEIYEHIQALKNRNYNLPNKTIFQIYRNIEAHEAQRIDYREITGITNATQPILNRLNSLKKRNRHLFFAEKSQLQKVKQPLEIKSKINLGSSTN